MNFTIDGEVLLRKEWFGGIAFHKKIGTTIELDEEAFFLLEFMSKGGSSSDIRKALSRRFGKSFSRRKVQSIVNVMMKESFLRIGSREVSEMHNDEETFRDNDQGERFLSAPETVHLTITHNCNFNCPSCYERGRSPEEEMSRKEMFGFIDDISEMKVFQLAIGGGEPFLRKDLIDIIEYCVKKEVVPNITSNGSLISSGIAKRLRGMTGQVNISLNGRCNGMNHGRDRGSFGSAMKGLENLHRHKINACVNVLVSKENLKDLNMFFEFLGKSGIGSINILRPKPSRPSMDNVWYERNRLGCEELRELRKILTYWDDRMRITVDTSLVCLMADLPSDILRGNGIYGCSAGSRFCSVDSNGDVYPCSFFKIERFLAGNVLEEDLQSIWRDSRILREFRAMPRGLNGDCGICPNKRYCKGCRRISLEECGDFLHEDPDCPIQQCQTISR